MSAVDLRPPTTLTTAVVGGGMLGLALALRLAKRDRDAVPPGGRVTLIESAATLGGLTRAFDYGPFVWDEFYHCILPQDRAMLRLIDEVGLTGELRWKKTGTGYFGRGAVHPMSSSWDFLKFPLLSLPQKARLAWSILAAKRIQDPAVLAGQTAEEWLIQTCGKRCYEVFWLPLLRSKFGEFYPRVDARFMWATITRLFGAREKGANTECLGYVRGGYARILQAVETRLRSLGVTIQTDTRVEQIGKLAAGSGTGDRCALTTETGTNRTRQAFDAVYFTAPAPVARRVAAPEFQPIVDAHDAQFPKAQDYLGVVCVNLVLRNPLTRNYVINIGGEDTGLTGVVEMTNLIDRDQETAGHSLVYLPKYLPAGDPRFDDPDERWIRALVTDGLQRLFPALRQDDIVGTSVHRAPFVQALPLAHHESPAPAAAASGPLRLVNTAQLEFATLNNSAVLDLAETVAVP